MVCIGDEIDAHAISFHSHDPDGFSAGMEHAEAIDELQKLYKLFPNVNVCVSNHTARPFRKALEHGIPKAFIRDYEDFMKAPKGWKWADHWEIDGVLYIHGEGFSGQNGAITAASKHRQSVVIGHIHSFGGVHYSASRNDLIFGLNSGCLIDFKAYSFNYARSGANRPTLGCGVVIDGKEALFVPLNLGFKQRKI